MILTTLLAAATLSAGPSAVLSRAETSPQTAEGTEILRRLLVEELEQAFRASHKPSKLDEEGLFSSTYSLPRMEVHGLATTLWTNDRTVQHSRAFHLPNVGLFLALDASLPVVAKTKKDEPAQDPKATDDEWERIRREVRGDLSVDGLSVRRELLLHSRSNFGDPGELDPQAIEKVIDRVLHTLAQHAARVEGLGSNDSITVALRLNGKSRTLWQGFSDEGGDSALYGIGAAEDEKAEGAQDTAIRAYVLASGQNVREQNLVVRIGLADLAHESAERLRSRAQINLY